MKKINLFCFPFAGGNKFSYRVYEPYASAIVNMVTVEYPGRGVRPGEACVRQMAQLLDDVYMSLYPAISAGKYAFYGHSMGAIVSFCLIKRLAAEGRPLPVHLFISGSPAPTAKTAISKKRHLMDKDDFLQEIKELDGCPAEVLENEELLNYFEPILRCDFEVSETFDYHHDHPLRIPITVITGDEEVILEEDLVQWQKESIRPVDFIKLPGRHFFILEYPQKVMHIINEKLNAHSKIFHI